MTAEQRIITDMEPVLFLGEGNFSFSIAIAARRGSWEGICATSNDVVENTAHRQLLDQINNVIEMHLTPADELDRIRAIVYLREGNPTRVGNVNAKKLSAFFNDPGTATVRAQFKQNIYFQCPWSFPGPQPDFLKSIITSAAEYQKKGNCLYFGLTSYEYYAKRYELDGENGVIAHAKEMGYILLDNDNIITTTAIAYGYYHHSNGGNDLHHDLLPFHYTLCLQMNKDDTKNLESSVSSLVI